MKIRILTQSFENYNYENYPDSPIWKAKGTQEFFVDVDDYFLYDEDLCIAAIKSLIAEKESALIKYQYISFEIVFSEPIKLTGFEDRLNTFRVLQKSSQIANQ